MNFSFLTPENIQIFVAAVFGFSLLTQLIFYFFIYSRVSFSNKKKPAVNDQPPVSVIICAKNEEENLRNFLPKILEQDYPVFEVIVVNDCSHDNTENLLDDLKSRYRHLKSTLIKEDPKFDHGKKLALTIGIKAASYDYLLLTDADCEPVSKKWLALMQRNFSREKSIVLGYGGYFRENGFLNNLIRYETMFIGMQYLGFAKFGFPYMGVGRNLAYKKDVFFKNKGFANHLHLLSGDDDLFIQQVAAKNNTTVEYSVEAHTRSIPKKTLHSWFRQKQRHLTTGIHYKGSIKFLIALEILTRYTLIGSFLYLLIHQFYLDYLIPLFTLRYLLFFVFIKLTMKQLSEKQLFLPSLLYDILLPFINFAAIITNFAHSSKNKWK